MFGLSNPFIHSVTGAYTEDKTTRPVREQYPGTFSSSCLRRAICTG